LNYYESQEKLWLEEKTLWLVERDKGDGERNGFLEEQLQRYECLYM
jgi:hypothetical protein